jgi:hypothetical protein
MHAPSADHPLLQLLWLFILAIPISCIAWTVTKEEVFKEPREILVHFREHGKNMFIRKFAYLFTCEYCFSHWVTLFFLIVTRYKLLLDDWRGYLISFFAIVWLANAYMSLYSRLRVDIQAEKTETKVKEKEAEKLEAEAEAARGNGS